MPPIEFSTLPIFGSVVQTEQMTSCDRSQRSKVWPLLQVQEVCDSSPFGVGLDPFNWIAAAPAPQRIITEQDEVRRRHPPPPAAARRRHEGGISRRAEEEDGDILVIVVPFLMERAW